MKGTNYEVPHCGVFSTRYIYIIPDNINSILLMVFFYVKPMMNNACALNILVSEPLGTTPPEKPNQRYYIKTDLKEGCRCHCEKIDEASAR